MLEFDLAKQKQRRLIEEARIQRLLKKIKRDVKVIRASNVEKSAIREPHLI